MKIKRLEIVGFKSFIDKVSLDFQNGITGVVGPNGCGKSNIIDAIRWVMGEQNARQLRGRAMEDVIFGGSESRKPHGMAEVSVVFDNSAKICPAAYRDYAEIMVTRRLYRNGESEYQLNKTPCRLLDITELFMDTGVGARSYSIIEQGKVGLLVSAKPEDRRALIEEAAGVTKFKSRKKTALRKMEATRQNLLRLSDIIAEVRRQVGSLKRQAQRAEKFREYRGEAKRIELCLTGNRFQDLQGEIGVLAAQEQEQAGLLARLDARLEEGDLQLEEKQLCLTAVEAELNREQQLSYHLASEIQRVENELTLSVRQRENLSNQEQELQQELGQLVRRLAELQTEKEQLQREEDTFGGRLSAVLEEVEQHEEQLRQALAEEQQLTAALETTRRTLLDLLGEANRLVNRRDEIERRLVADADRSQQIQNESIRLGEQLQLLAEQRQQSDQQLLQVREQQQRLSEEALHRQGRQQQIKGDLEQQTEELNRVRQQLERSRSRQESLEELERNLDGYADGVRALLAKKESWREIAADLFRVDHEHETAVEMTLGERLQAIPAESTASIAVALQLLTEQQARATLLVPQANPKEVSFSAGIPLSSLVRAKPGAEPVVAALFAGTFLVEDIAAFLSAELQPGILLVDCDGTCLSWRGELTGGAAVASGSGLLRKKRQLEGLGLEVAQLAEEFSGCQAVFDAQRNELIILEEEQTEAANGRHQLELQALNLEKDLQGVQNEVGRLQERQELLAFDLEQLLEGCAALQKEKAQLQVGSLQSREQQDQLEARSAQLQLQLGEQRVRLDGCREQLTEKRIALAASQQQQQGLRDTLKRLENQHQELIHRQTQLEQRQVNGDSEQQQLVAQEQRLRAELEALLNRREEQLRSGQSVRERYEQERQYLDEQRDQLRGIRGEAETLRKEVARLQLRHHEFLIDAEHVRQGVLERYRVDLLEHQVPEATEDELSRQQEQLKRLQQRIEALGEVNLMAIDEYREQEERYEFLTRQRDDLHQSLEDLQKAISQINRTTRRRFKETFDLVNEKFKIVFPRLFRGGQAELRLTNEEDLLETGIEIVVQPPGKRLQSVNLLSGGEKALTAVALIFSLFLIKPTPFCVLDEVDAPLDDANIDRFAEMVREMTAQSQFIIITHSKRTMSIVDTMYGVTMQEPGVSKLVSVRMNDLLPVAEMQAASA